MRSLILVRRSQVASALLINDLLDLAKIESVKRKPFEKNGLEASPEIKVDKRALVKARGCRRHGAMWQSP